MVVMATGLSEEKEKKALIQKLHVPSTENVLCYAVQEKKSWNPLAQWTNKFQSSLVLTYM